MTRNISKKKNKINIFMLLSILTFVLIIVGLPAFVKRMIVIDTIKCQTQIGSCPDEFVNYFELLEGRNYYDIKKQVNDYLKTNVMIDEYLLQYQLPKTIDIEIIIKKPKYSIKVGNSHYQVTSDGLVVSVSDQKLPINLETESSANYVFGQKISDAELEALAILEKVEWLYSVGNGKLKNNVLSVVLDEGPTVLFAVEKDVDLLMGSLRLIFSRLNDDSSTIRMSGVREIDLRFKNPVLR